MRAIGGILKSAVMDVARNLAVGVIVAAAGGEAAAAEAPAGYSDISVAGNTALRGDPSGRLSVVIWYPAAPQSTVEPITIGPPGTPYFAEGEGARDAPLAALPQRLPFVVVSHGTGGSASDLAWLCAGLAQRGFIVAAVNHPGNNALAPPTVAGNTVWWLRADDLARVIDGVLALPRFGPRIDPARIGAAGVSLGGYTVLVAAGVRADRHRLDLYCARKPQTPVCNGQATPEIPNLRAQAQALADSDPAYQKAVDANSVPHRDARIKAVFAIEPAEGPAIIPESLAAVTVPVALVAGFGDEVLPLTDNVIPDALAIPDAQLTLFPKPAGHAAFITDCAPAGRAKFPAVCADAGPARIAIHRATLELAASFFARTIGP